MNTRDIASKLYAYADLLDAETSKLNARWRITGEDADAVAHNRYEHEAADVRVMAHELWDAKASV